MYSLSEHHQFLLVTDIQEERRYPVCSDTDRAVAVQCEEAKGALEEVIVNGIIWIVGVHGKRHVMLR